MSIKLHIASLFVLLGLLVGCTNNTTSGTANQATGKVDERVELDRETLDFGSVEMGDVISKRLKLRNGTSKMLHITDIGASCECTQPMVLATEIESGSSATIEVMLDAHGLIGRQYHKVTICTDADTVEFAVLAEIIDKYN